MFDRSLLPLDELVESTLDGRKEKDPLARLRELFIWCMHNITTDEQRRRVFDILFTKCEFVEEMGPVRERHQNNMQGGMERIERTLRNAVDKQQLPARLDTRRATVMLHTLFSSILHNSLLIPDLVDPERDSEALIDASFDALKCAVRLYCCPTKPEITCLHAARKTRTALYRRASSPTPSLETRADDAHATAARGDNAGIHDTASDASTPPLADASPEIRFDPRVPGFERRAPPLAAETNATAPAPSAPMANHASRARLRRTRRKNHRRVLDLARRQSRVRVGNRRPDGVFDAGRFALVLRIQCHRDLPEQRNRRHRRAP